MSDRNLVRLAVVTVLAATVAVTAGCSDGQSRKEVHLNRGRKFLEAHNYEKASVEFQNVMQIDPKDAQVRYEEGVVEEKLGRLQQAIQDYQSAIALAPQQDHLDATIALAKVMVLHGAASRTLAVVKTGLLKHPDQPELLALRAAALMEQKDIPGALADAQRAVQLAPKNEEAIATLAGIYKFRGNPTQSEALIEHALQDIPGSTDLHFLLGQLYTDAGRIADAEAQFKKLVELQPTESSHRIRLAQFYQKTNQSDAAEAVLRRAVRDFPADRNISSSLVDLIGARRGPAAAVEELKKMVAAAPKDYELQLSLAVLYRRAGDDPRAEAIYNDLIAKQGTGPVGLRARNLLADLRLQQHDQNTALTLANQVIAENPHDNDALLIRGSIELARNNPRATIVDLREVLRDQPDNPQVLQALVNAHIANNEPQIAEQVMRQATEANPRNATLAIEFSHVLVSLGRADEAATVVAAAVKLAPENETLLDEQFRVAMTTKDLATAKAASDAMVAQQPKLALGYMYQGTVAEAEKRFDEALRLYGRAADLQPDAAEPMEAKVRVLAQAKRLPEALSALDAAAGNRPRDPVPFDLKGQILIRSGRFADAKDAFKQAIARAPKWWSPYRGMADAQLLAKEDLPSIIDGLRRAKGVVDQTEPLTVGLAELLVRAEKPDEALAEYEEALRKYPKSDVLANNLAMLLVTYRTDATSLGRAKELAARFADSPSPAFRDTYGWVLYKRGEASAAVPVFARIVAQSPKAAVGRFHLGMAQALAGDLAEARDNLTRAVDSGQRFPGLDEAITALARLSKAAPDGQPRT